MGGQDVSMHEITVRLRPSTHGKGGIESIEILNKCFNSHAIKEFYVHRLTDEKLSIGEFPFQVEAFEARYREGMLI